MRGLFFALVSSALHFLLLAQMVFFHHNNRVHMLKKFVISALAACTTVASLSAVAAPVISQNADAMALANTITGGGLTILNATLTGSAVQSGTFTGGLSSVGFASGIVLSTGDVGKIPGANVSNKETLGDGGGGSTISRSLGTAGYAPLTTQAGGQSYDAAVLEISFMFGDGSIGGDVFMNYVFASEEYINFVGFGFNDAFAFYLDGVNIALIPGTSTPVSINNVNPLANSAHYINNVANTNGYSVAGRDFQFDGLTTTLTASALNLAAGQHTMTFAIADIDDGLLDSAVFLQGDSFTNAPTTSVPTAIPEPGSLALLSLGLAAAVAVNRKRKT